MCLEDKVGTMLDMDSATSVIDEHSLGINGAIWSKLKQAQRMRVKR